ncbi:hypothetical protein HFQ13_08255 [Acidithiobacillus sp. VAN18-1]|uniref:Uncharacterized protein n=1 Tax=Igneacidithiobacillus copahuensis TaxID=2724909 RepID=A0AAE3CJX0_9PROT|nr:hypothetical protein [Igneacidithiobacillus copahuensis]MBU2788196.1 hypothetical protein [Igneacidithiobacillus copahuensis]MBU2797503.1 hypothetical protein [Acidithiobacillus sp. VAN18-2]
MKAITMEQIDEIMRDIKDMTTNGPTVIHEWDISAVTPENVAEIMKRFPYLPNRCYTPVLVSKSLSQHSARRIIRKARQIADASLTTGNIHE